MRHPMITPHPPKPKLSTIVIIATALALCLLYDSSSYGQQTCDRIMIQDSTLDNLGDPSGYRSGQLGALGKVQQVGMGPQAMVLIPGLGFGGNVFAEFMERHSDEYRMYAVTLPGFGGTPAPPAPSEETSFGDQTWTNGALRALEELIERESIEQPIVVGHWLTGTQLALRLALEHPEQIQAVIVLAGSTRFVPTDTTRMPSQMPLTQRIAGIDHYMAPLWFKTVTRETWDDNNFLPVDYAVNPVRGLRLWREAAEPKLHVWVRYLCEFYAQDVSFELERLSVPTLVVKPGLDGIYHDPGNNYMEAYCHKSWEGIERTNPKIKMVTVPDSRVCLWFDQPEKLDAVINAFLGSLE